MSYEYKTVGAPERGKRRRGSRSRSDRIAAAFEEILAEHAVDGWEYMRTDLVPVIERDGFFSRPQPVHRAVMVFRRRLEPARPSLFGSISEPGEPMLRSVPTVAPAPEPEPPAPKLTPTPGEDPELKLAQFIRPPRKPDQRD